MSTVANLFGQDIKVGDLLAVATSSGHRVSNRLVKILSVNQHGALARIYVMSKDFIYVPDGTSYFSEPYIKKYNRYLTRLKTAIPVDFGSIPENFKEALDE